MIKMKKQYDKEMIIYTIEAVENLGINGFHWGKRDNKFLKSQDELKLSVDKIIVCLDWLDEGLNYFTYFANYNCYASDVKKMIEQGGEIEIPLGCIITAIMYNYQKLDYEKECGKKDLTFRLPSHIRDKIEIKKRIIYDL
jgi:hypothetical protein